jgi:hypothetical protein
MKNKRKHFIQILNPHYNSHQMIQEYETRIALNKTYLDIHKIKSKTKNKSFEKITLFK